MDLNKTIKEAVKDNRVVFGYKSVIKEIKTGKPKLVVHSNNLPSDKLENILHNSKISKITVEEYPKDNLELGLVCGKPFSVSVLAIKGSEK